MFMVIKGARRLDTRSVTQPGDARSLCAFCPSAHRKTLFLRNEPSFHFGINGFAILAVAKRTQFLRCEWQIFNFRRIGSATAPTRCGAIRTFGAGKDAKGKPDPSYG